MKQLFANNAKTTLANPLAINGTSLVVTDGTLFPTPATNEYFLCTIELGSSIEVVMITARTGNVFTIGGLVDVGETIAGRGQELTVSKAFAAGARVECRVTKGTLSRYSVSLAQMAAVTSLAAPKDSYQDGYVINTLDPFGNPIVVVPRDTSTWRSLNFTTTNTGTATAATTTSVTTTSLVLSSVTTGKYLIQFTSGVHSGKIRVVSSNAANVVNWTGALSPAPSVGDTFEILKSNASILFDVLSIGDDAVIMPLLLGGD